MVLRYLTIVIVVLVLDYVRGAGVKLAVEGLVPSVFTPFDEKGQIDLNVIPGYAEYLQQNKIDGALVAGTASEGPSLSLFERKELLKAWMEAAKPRGLKVVMQVGGMPLPEVLEIAKYSEAIGVDAILTLPELYYKPGDEKALVRLVQRISDAAPTTPILFYDHPSLSGVKLNMVKFFGLATKSITNFKGIKCGFTTALDITAAHELSNDQRIFINSHLVAASAFAMGFNSSMTTITNLFPEQMMEIERAVHNSDVAKARALQQTLNQNVAVITSQGGYVPFVKAAMAMINCVDVGNTRDPLSQVTEEQKEILYKQLQNITELCPKKSTKE